MALSNQVITGYLIAHNVATKEVNGTLYALNVWHDERGDNCSWVVVSGWTRKELLTWLGY